MKTIKLEKNKMKKQYSTESLNDRMSGYEEENRIYLDKNKWTIIRLDGRSFSKFTKPFKRPFDDKFIKCMNKATISLFESITNVKYGYTQSDEITIIMSPVKNEESELPFGGRTDKLLSLSVSTVTGEFVRNLVVTNLFDIGDIYDRKLPQFDSRYFQVDSEIEAINALIARQNDCSRNAISSIAQYYFSHKELMNKNIDDMRFMLMTEKGVDVDEYHSHHLLGRLITRKQVIKVNDEMEEYIRSKVDVEEKTIRFRNRFKDIFDNK